MHVANPILLNELDLVTSLILKVNYYYSEIDIDEASRDESMRSVFTSDKSISKTLGGKKYHKLRRILIKSFGTDIFHFDHFLPFIIVNQLSLSLLEGSSDISLDHYLWEFAKRNGKELKGLESTSSQIEILQKIPWEYQLKQLILVSKAVKNYKTFVLKMFEAYKQQDILGLYQMSQKSMGKYKNIMLKDRNIVMTDNIHTNRDLSAFYAIGAAHLAGYHGVLRMLRKAGYEVALINNI